MPDITLPGPTGTLRGYLATPAGDGPWPGVVVLHEAFGLTTDIRRQTDQLAMAGYLALAPDLFSEGGRLRCLIPTFRALTRGNGRAFDDIDAARDWLAGRDDCTAKVGVIGFCMGGGFALLCAPREGYAAASSNYGSVPKEPERVLAGACPIVGSYGGRDPGLRGQARRLDTALTNLGVEHDVKEYPEAGHSFLNRHSSGPLAALERVVGFGYHEEPAHDAWQRIFAFFDTHLRAEPHYEESGGAGLE